MTSSIKKVVVEETRSKPKVVKETTSFAKEEEKAETDSVPMVAKEMIELSKKEEEEKTALSMKRALEVTPQP